MASLIYGKYLGIHLFWSRDTGAGGSKKTHTRFWSENLKERDDLENLGVDGMIILQFILKDHGVRLSTVFNWIRIAFIGGLL